jgi:hypothetical protein
MAVGRTTSGGVHRCRSITLGLAVVQQVPRDILDYGRGLGDLGEDLLG